MKNPIPFLLYIAFYLIFPMVAVGSLTGAPHWATYVPFLLIGTNIGYIFYRAFFKKIAKNKEESRFFYIFVGVLILLVGCSTVVWYVTEEQIRLYYYIISAFFVSFGFFVSFTIQALKFSKRSEE